MLSKFLSANKSKDDHAYLPPLPFHKQQDSDTQAAQESLTVSHGGAWGQ